MDRSKSLAVGMALATWVLFAAASALHAQSTEPFDVAVSESYEGNFQTSCSSCAEAACPVCDSGCLTDCGCGTCCWGHWVDWSVVPESIRPMPRPGNFPFPRQGCGYYTLCDQLRGICRDKPPQNGYPPFALMASPFYDADFRYVENLDVAEQSLAERLKRIPLNDCMTFSTGGQFWARFHNEHNSRLTETDNSYTLAHVRLYGDLLIGDRVRLFGEYLWADSFSEELAPLPIDVDRGDALNLFVELNLFDYDGKPVFARVGRQELLFGSQRLITPLPWANTRRTFDGVKLFRNGEKWDVDLFYTAFVPPAANDFNQADDDREFGGAWTTYRPQKGHFVDLYYLYFDNSNAVTQQSIVRAPTESHTVGSRYAGDRCGYLWDVEAALQFGDQGGQDLFAGMATVGVGRNFKEACWSPTVWFYYDYASGDSDPTTGDAHTFNQLFPFGHYFLGWMDLVGRQNIHDVNAHLIFYPQPWLTVWLQYHHFWLDQSQDALYNAGGVAYRRDPSGAAGTHVGDEFDIVLNFHLTKNSDILVSYNKLYGGGFLEATSSPTEASDAETLYLMFQQKW